MHVYLFCLLCSGVAVCQLYGFFFLQFSFLHLWWSSSYLYYIFINSPILSIHPDFYSLLLSFPLKEMLWRDVFYLHLFVIHFLLLCFEMKLIVVVAIVYCHCAIMSVVLHLLFASVCVRFVFFFFLLCSYNKCCV